MEDGLLANHLAFLASHRGKVTRDGAVIFIESDRPEFTYAILRKSATLSAVPNTTKTVQLFASCEITAEDLTKAGFVRTIGLSYMVLTENPPPWRVRRDLTIARVRSQAEMDIFSDVQSHGFCETEESFASWHPWLKAANDRNLTNPSQMFFVACLSGEPVGTALTVFDGKSTGIYAVATLAQHRKEGVSATIMQQAIQNTKAGGCGVITLQAKQDSYVEEFYRHLGFERIFAASMYRRD